MQKRKKTKKITADPIFVSPDGGETVYQQLPDGNRVLVEQSQKAKDEETIQDENEMVNEYAIQMRRKYPALGKAWKHYKTVWHLVMGNK